jgi:dienelactone hydrolase
VQRAGGSPVLRTRPRGDRARIAAAVIVRVVLVLVAVGLLAGSASAGGFPRFGPGCGRDDFTSAGTRVRAELCRSARGDPVVVVLHGCGGFSTFDHRLVTTLPTDGISTLDVDYFAPTPAPGTRGFCGAGRAIEGAFASWIAVTRDAAASLRSQGFRHVGLVGWSLGGGVGVAAAASAHARTPFAALAGFSTGAFGAQQLAADLPPTILLSAGRTDAIPLMETLPLYRALRRAHVRSSLYVYPNGSHNWPGRQGALGIAHAAAFLRRYLR